MSNNMNNSSIKVKKPLTWRDIQMRVEAETSPSEVQLCLMIKVVNDHRKNPKDCLDNRNGLSDYLETMEFVWEESTGRLACFSDGDYDRFREEVARYANRHHLEVAVQHCVDPGLGLEVDESKWVPIPMTFRKFGYTKKRKC